MSNYLDSLPDDLHLEILKYLSGRKYQLKTIVDDKYSYKYIIIQDCFNTILCWSLVEYYYNCNCGHQTCNSKDCHNNELENKYELDTTWFNDYNKTICITHKYNNGNPWYLFDINYITYDGEYLNPSANKWKIYNRKESDLSFLVDDDEFMMLLKEFNIDIDLKGIKELMIKNN